MSICANISIGLFSFRGCEMSVACVRWNEGDSFRLFFFLMVMFILLLVSQFVVRLVCILWISIRSGKGKTVRICSFVIVLWKNVYLFSIFLYWLCVFDVIYFSECNVF